MEDSSGGFTIIGIIILIIVFIAVRRSKAAEVGAAHQWYENLLDQLKQNPNDPELYQATLEAGRTYSNLTRERRGVTIYDEAALSNDLNAARARTGQHIASQTISFPQSASVSVSDRLRQLDGLRSQGLITDDEYAAKRQRLLDEL